MIGYIRGILGFFGGLDRTAAEDIEREAENVTYTAEEERAVRRKVDLRVLPIIVLSYICESCPLTAAYACKAKDLWDFS